MGSVNNGGVRIVLGLLVTGLGLLVLAAVPHPASIPAVAMLAMTAAVLLLMTPPRRSRSR